MRSGTSFFNGPLFRKTVLRFWPLWFSYAFVLALALPVRLAGRLGRAATAVDAARTAQFVPVEFLGSLGLVAAPIIGCAAAMALEELGGRDRGTGWLTAAAIALHNVPEGMVIGAGDLRFGMTAAVLIGLHDLPEGMAVGAALLSGGARGLRAAAAAAAAGLPTVAGAGLGWFLGTLSPGAEALAVGAASGAMLYVSLAQLLPQAVRIWSARGAAAAAAAGVAAGLVVSA